MLKDLKIVDTDIAVRYFLQIHVISNKLVDEGTLNFHS